MVLDEVGIIIASVIAGLAGGFLSSWMSFNASGEKFDPRKHGNGLITGAISGMAAGVAAASTLPVNATAAQITVALFLVFFGTVGVDSLRTKGSRMISKNPPAEVEPTPPPPPAAPPSS